MSDVTHLNQMYIHSREQFLILESRFPADAERRHIADGAARFASRWLSGYGRLRSQRGMPWHRGIPLKYATARDNPSNSVRCYANVNKPLRFC